MPSMISFVKTLVSMSASSVWIILAVIILRLILRRIPKQGRVLMWILPAVRLTVPFRFESRFSVTPEFTKAVPAMSPIYSAPVSRAEIIMTVIWAAVTLGMLLYMIISFVRLKIRVRASLNLRDNIFICDTISSPFVLGLFRPKIYVPSDIDGKALDYVLMHEQAHIRRLDTVWKPLAFLILSVHWFNPLVWAAYVLFNRDIELACDEQAVKKLTFGRRREYSTALLDCCTKNSFTAACPFAFGEKPVKQRIKSVLGYKKPKLVYKLAAVVCCAAATLLFLTNPVTAKVVRDNSVVSVNPLKNIWDEPPVTEPATEPSTIAPTETVEKDEEPHVEDYAEAEYSSNSEEIYYEADNYSGYEAEDDNYSENYSDNSGNEPVGYVEPRPFESDTEKYVLEKNWWENPVIYNVRGERID